MQTEVQWTYWIDAIIQKSTKPTNHNPSNVAWFSEILHDAVNSMKASWVLFHAHTPTKQSLAQNNHSMNFWYLDE